MLRIPVLRQPTDVACLPTCVRAVLAYGGYQLTEDDAAAICRMRKAGAAAELAVQGLVDAGVDAELRQFDGVDDLRCVLDDGQPVIAILQHPAGGTHAVVVCDVNEDTVTLMDPALGDYLRLPREHFEELWSPIQSEGMLIGKDLGVVVRANSCHAALRVPAQAPASFGVVDAAPLPRAHSIIPDPSASLLPPTSMAGILRVSRQCDVALCAAQPC